MKKVLFILLSLVFCCNLSAQTTDEFETGVSYYQNGDYQKAFSVFKRLAEQGRADALYNLGVMCYNGQGVTKDNTQAFNWFKKAAEQGYANAQHRLGGMYHLGEGVAKDRAKALYWFRKAADQGDKRAKIMVKVLEQAK